MLKFWKTLKKKSSKTPVGRSPVLKTPAKRCLREQSVKTSVRPTPSDHHVSPNGNLPSIKISERPPDPTSRLQVRGPEEELFQELICPVCVQIYTDPVIFPCFHSLCHTCVEAIKSISSLFLCPECRRPVNGEPMRHFLLQKMVNLFQQNPDLPSVKRMIQQAGSVVTPQRNDPEHIQTVSIVRHGTESIQPRPVTWRHRCQRVLLMLVFVVLVIIGVCFRAGKNVLNSVERAIFWSAEKIGRVHIPKS